ncbi:MAG: BphX family protein [Bacillota bacterium]
MQHLRRWMYGVGALYLFLALMATPPFMSRLFPLLGHKLEPSAQRVLLDGIIFISAIVGLLGIFLLRGAKYPNLHRELVKLVIWVEVIAGACLNLYLALRGYGSPILFSLMATGHAIIALLGREALIRDHRHLSPVHPFSKAS